MNASRCFCFPPTAALLLLALALPAHATDSMRERANAALGLEDSRVVSIDVDRTPGIGQTVAFDVGGDSLTLVLTPHAVRSGNYRLLLQQADGVIVEGQPAAITPVRGIVTETAGVVAGVVTGQGLFASLEIEGRERMWIEPLSGVVAGAGPADHVIYTESNVVAGGKTCAAAAAKVNAMPSVGGGGGCDGDLCVAEMVIDADFEYFSQWGTGTEARILLVINTVNAQFERDVGITHAISALMIRTAEPDPYTSTDCAQLLQQFRDEWMNNHPEIQLDLAQLFTGKELDGGIISCTFGIGTVCSDDAFGVVQSDAVGSLQCVTDLHAHELGHMWAAVHCACPNHTMNPALTCANAFDPEQTVPDIISFRDSVDCLESSGSPPEIVHDGIGGETFPGTGFIDPAMESDNANNILGYESASIRFSAAMSDCGGGPLTTANILLTETGAGPAPHVTGVSTIDGDDSFIQVDWDRPITLQEWSTITVVNACDGAGVALLSLGDLGPGAEEPDRVDIGFLPANVDQNNSVTPFDLLKFRQLVIACGGGPFCAPDVQPLLDLDRNGHVSPFDLLHFHQLVLGEHPATQPWAGESMNNAQP